MQPLGLRHHSLALDPAIDSHFLTVASDTLLVDVLALMSQFRSCMLPASPLGESSEEIQTGKISCISQEGELLFDVSDTAAGCVLVMKESQLAGVFTERDIVKLTATGISLAKVKIADIMAQPPILLRQSQTHDIFTALGLFRQHRIRHLPIVDEQGQPMGIVTHESIRRALQPVNLLTRLRCVKDVMTTQVIHAPVTASGLRLAQLMTEHQVSCVIIAEQDWEAGETRENFSQSLIIPVGIVTERDIVQFQALELDMSRMCAGDVMSTPVFCLHPSDSLWVAHEEMHRRHVRRLIVTGDWGELVGIVSQTSLLQVLNPADMYGVIELLQQAVEERTVELKQTNERLRHEIFERQKAELELLKAHDQLKIKVEQRTAQLTQANFQLKQDIQERQRVEAALRQSEAKLKQQTNELKQALQKLHSYQSQLIQTEKMSSLGQLVAGVAHEINNPINFIYGNIAYASQYIQDIMHLLQLYEQEYPQPERLIQEVTQEIDLEFVKTDLPKIIDSMKLGADRIRNLVLSLRNFSRLDEAEMKSVNLHEGLDNTLLILQNQLKAAPGHSEIKVIKKYGDLPLLECYPGQLNQVFMNLIGNAIDALEELRTQNSQLATTNGKCPAVVPTIVICTDIEEGKDWDSRPQGSAINPHVAIRIADNGSGMTETVRQRLFDPFFTTKPVGKGTGLGLSISYQIVVEKHGGRIHCVSTPGQGTEFVIEIPIRQRSHSPGFAIA
ncbi:MULTISPECIES: CBS domain-containing protein [unclassified Coleofasciculus]|uniref:CBS domain-containing protein n=1 Tax=unclassified Coleofasciculus TaxID=2692782 RepID=UPI001880B4C9|nr:MULTISPECIES: CBS domain-containing protein [unclassified Coleofasciculus]MBE9127827.1 CBS domain-containing protein [Coleofasciculus sp. LEGE 07081]MBE9149420.1 CBS domain-containing protein [Coleofasciculus sp. LEGE 07092]